ncbi:IS1182 family transposase [Noviherbaspirillum sp. Root189]|uniref:IS1182 family transposase n=1 Tax=Noviherbaspirillum sp. Root189 TaxID=1736487 RepID=UPI00070CD229|nr:IS1182 family transposase [Noviherbaspirillum sp. Root189]KRB85156.1 transposase [Noviherbaspirillum sp. Root189]
MARFKPVDMNPRFLPIVLEQQIQPGTFEHALNVLIDTEFDLTPLAARYINDVTGAPAYDPSVLLKIVLLAYSRGIISSRAIERACRENVLFMAISGDTQPAYTTIASFIRHLGDQIANIFTEVILICDRRGLIGRDMFAIDGVKLPSNASKARSGTHAELAHQADAIERRVRQMIKAHRQLDKHSQEEQVAAQRKAEQERIHVLQTEAQSIREFLRTHRKRTGDESGKGPERKSNVTDNDSAKMATGKGVIQGYTGAATVDAACQIIVAAQAHGSGSEQSLLLPMIEHAQPFANKRTVMTADAGYHSEANLKQLHDKGIPALIADGLMRKRDERFKEQAKHKNKPDPLANKKPISKALSSGKFKPTDFHYDPVTNTCICPAGKKLYSNGINNIANGRIYRKFVGAKSACMPCNLRQQCLRKPDTTKVRQVAIFRKNQTSPLKHTDSMKLKIDTTEGRAAYGRRIATVEPVFGNLRYNKRLDRFTLRGQRKVDTQWKLYCMVHNIEKLAHHGYAR